jgi:hypothetical protein
VAARAVRVHQALDAGSEPEIAERRTTPVHAVRVARAFHAHLSCCRADRSIAARAVARTETTRHASMCLRHAHLTQRTIRARSTLDAATIVDVAVGCRRVAIGGFRAPFADVRFRVAQVARAVRVGQALHAGPGFSVAEPRACRAIRRGPAARRGVRGSTRVAPESTPAAARNAAAGTRCSRVGRSAEERDIVRRAAARRHRQSDGKSEGYREAAPREWAHPRHERPFTDAEHRRTPHPMTLVPHGDAREPGAARHSRSRPAVTSDSAPGNR